MKTCSIPRFLAGGTAAALAGIALVLPIGHAEARKGGGVSVRDHRTAAPVVRTDRGPTVDTAKRPGGVKVVPSAGSAKKLTCVGPNCPRQFPPAPKATTTGTNKAPKYPVRPEVTIRDHRRPKCFAGRCRPRQRYHVIEWL